jgi:hypothetical protein
MPRKKDKIDEMLRDFFSREKPMQQIRAQLLRLDAPAREQQCLFEASESIAESSRMKLYRRAFKEPCPPLEILAGFLDRVLDEKLARKVAEHLECCTKCSAMVKEGTSSVKDHASGKTPRVPDDISTETTTKLRALHRKSRTRTPRKKRKGS